jgi:serine/threonine protein kinase
MEFLPTNLTSCIEQYGILPKEISYSILHDVALGLHYLHSQTPPIIHRDLSSNNVLLTPNMTAKISDLGVARILNLTPLQVSRMTQTPGTPAYMPPEVMVANPKYDTSVDEFSYGIMMIHMFSGQWPEPQVGPSQIEGGKLIPVTEAERREVFLNVIKENHPLMDLIHRCLNNDPQLRPHAGEIIKRVRQIESQFPASFANRLEMLGQIKRDGREKGALTEEGEINKIVIQEKNDEISIQREKILTLSEEGERKDGIIMQKENQILSHRKEVQVEKEQKTIEMDRLKSSHSIEVEQLQLQLRDMRTQNQYTKAENEAEIVELKSKYSALETQIENMTKILIEEREKSARQLREEREQHEIHLRKKTKRLEIQLAKEKEQLVEEREANTTLISDVQDLQSGLLRSKSENTTLQGAVSRLQSDKDAAIQMKEAIIRRKDSELEAKSRALGEKDATISAMSERITKTREYLATNKPLVSTLIGLIRCEN